jgi:hypothetical protein
VKVFKIGGFRPYFEGWNLRSVDFEVIMATVVFNDSQAANLQRNLKEPLAVKNKSGIKVRCQNFPPVELG